MAHPLTREHVARAMSALEDTNHALAQRFANRVGMSQCLRDHIASEMADNEAAYEALKETFNIGTGE